MLMIMALFFLLTLNANIANYCQHLQLNFNDFVLYLDPVWEPPSESANPSGVNGLDDQMPIFGVIPGTLLQPFPIK